MSRAAPASPEFLKLAADPVRWRLLDALSGGDLRVGELCARLDRRQNLVSYHLGRLRSAGLVQRRRSSADGRDGYYLLDLKRCAEMLGEVAGALHPGLLVAGAPAPALRLRAGDRVDTILFLCTGNSARVADRRGACQHICRRSRHSPQRRKSPQAAASQRDARARREWDHRLSAVDATGHAAHGALRPRDHAVRPSARDLSGVSRSSGDTSLEHPDPARSADTNKDTYPAFVTTQDEIERRVRFLLAELAVAGRLVA